METSTTTPKTKTKEKKENMDSQHVYRFVSSPRDIDFVRILREAPKGTPFILVEERTRSNKPKASTLFISLEVLNNPNLQGKRLADGKISPSWGHNNNPGMDGPDYISGYRYFAFYGRFPGHIKQQIERLKSALNPKNTKTEVSYL